MRFQRTAPRPASVPVLNRVALFVAAALAFAGSSVSVSHAGSPGVPIGSESPGQTVPKIERVQPATAVRVPANRVLKLARVDCQGGTCTVRNVRVRFEVGGETFSNTGRSRRKIQQGKSAIVRSTLPARLRKQLRKGVESGTVTVFVTVTSSNGSRISSSIRTGLMG